MAKINEKLDSETIRQGIGYLVVGGSSAAIELVLFLALSLLAGLNVSLSNVIAVVSSTTFNFLVNRNVTFKSASNPLRSLVLYLVLFCFNTTFTTTVITLFVNWGCPHIVIKLITMGCVVLWNFVLYKKVIFK